jgi:hypothetical protein
MVEARGCGEWTFDVSPSGPPSIGWRTRTADDVLGRRSEATERRFREMFALRSIVIARQLDELRAESAARRLARTEPSSDDHTSSPQPRRRTWSVRDDPSPILPALTNYPFPAR